MSDKYVRIGEKKFIIDGRPYVMGILNVTPDSFSDGGKYNKKDAALFHVEEMIKDGADIIDVGGESTRPDYTMISNEEEIERVSSVIELIKKSFDIPVTLDTYKYEVAIEGMKSGADMINDIWGLRWKDTGDKMAAAVKSFDKGIILMHNRDNTEYSDFTRDVMDDLRISIEVAKRAGISEDSIILDPGVGFAKDLRQNRLITNRLEMLNEFGYPVLLGTSRKSMIGLTLDLPRDEREEGTMATSVIGLMKGASFFRVHDVKKNRRALDMTYAIINEG